MKTDYILHQPISIPNIHYPYDELTYVQYLVCCRVGSSVRVNGSYTDYNSALEKAADMSIAFKRGYFVVMVENKVRVI